MNLEVMTRTPSHEHRSNAPRLQRHADENRKDATAARVEFLAAGGLSKAEIAVELNMSTREFKFRLAKNLSIYQAWERGAKTAGTFKENQKPRTLEADEGVVVLQPIDTIVLAALKVGQTSKRMPALRQLTGLDTGKLVKSLERLEANLQIKITEGLVFTEYEAY
jgi:DNA-binding transcriptional regulator YiaG